MRATDVNDELVRLLEEVLEDLGVSAGELGRDAGLGKDTLSRWMRGGSHPSLESYRRFVAHLSHAHGYDVTRLWQAWRATRAIGRHEEGERRSA